MKKTIAIGWVLAAAGAGCSWTALSEPVTLRGPRVEAAGAATPEILAAAEASFALLAEVLEIDPGPVRLYVAPDAAAFDAAVGPEAAGADGLYRPSPRPHILVVAPADPRVIRHELGHHFATALLGDLPPWLGEGIAELLEGARRGPQGVEVPLVAPRHLDRLLEGRAVTETHSVGNAHHAHVDYASAWARVALRLEREPGSLRGRLLALVRRAGVDEPEPGIRELSDFAGRQRRVIEALLRIGDDADRAASARLLGRLGERAPLHEAWIRERELPILATIAGSLARAGDATLLRRLRPWIVCLHVLDDVSRSAGRDFGSVEALDAWLE